MAKDDIEDDCDSTRMTLVDQVFQGFRRTKGFFARKISDWTITPVETALDRIDGHEFQTVDSQSLQIVQSLNNAFECRVELLHLKLVHDQVVQSRSFIVLIVPGERGTGPLVERC